MGHLKSITSDKDQNNGITDIHIDAKKVCVTVYTKKVPKIPVHTRRLVAATRFFV